MANEENDAESNVGILLAFLIPAAIALGKAAAAGAVSAGTGYGTKKALEVATRKRRPINDVFSRC